MKTNKKGFTIVELVIVIAVIAILAAVLIPTFSSITNSARQSAAQQQAKAGLDSILALTSGSLPDGTLFAISSNDDHTVSYEFQYTGNSLKAVDATSVPEKYATGVYAIYVSAECWVKADGGSAEDTAKAAAAKAATEALIESSLKTADGYTNVSDVTLSAAKVTGKDYFTLTLSNGPATADEFRVYYTTDIQSTQVVYIGID